MDSRSHSGWHWRLVWSSVLATAAVVWSMLLVLFLSARRSSQVASAITYVVGIPLLPGFAFVSAVWGSYRAFHQSRILLLIPLSSFVIDATLLFVAREFLHGARSRELASNSTLQINR